MLTKSVILASLGLALATPVLAETVNPGLAMEAKLLNVEPGKYTAAELGLLATARQEGDSVTEQAILNKTLRSGFDSTYFVDGATLSSSDE